MSQTEPSAARGEASATGAIADLSPMEPTRRDFLYLATAAVGAVGAAATLWPLVDQMNPDAATKPPPGRSTSTSARSSPASRSSCCGSRPVFVVNRPKAALDALQRPAHLALLSDPNSTARQQPDYATNWNRSIKPEILASGRRLHPSRLHPEILSAAEPDRTGAELAGRLFLPLPRLEIRPRRPSLPRRPGALQPARPALSFPRRQDPARRREPARGQIRFFVDLQI